MNIKLTFMRIPMQNKKNAEKIPKACGSSILVLGQCDSDWSRRLKNGGEILSDLQ